VAGKEVLGNDLLSSQADPTNPTHQIARLSNGTILESTVVGSASNQGAAGAFLCDKLTL